jgi:hypothetical protein
VKSPLVSYLVDYKLKAFRGRQRGENIPHILTIASFLRKFEPFVNDGTGISLVKVSISVRWSFWFFFKFLVFL